MPKTNTKNTQYKSFEVIFGDSLYELFHPNSDYKLINYDDLKLVNVDELKLINTEDFAFVEKRHFNLVHLPTIAFFIQYVGAFALTITLMLGLFFTYALMTTPGISNPQELANKMIEENQVNYVAMESRYLPAKGSEDDRLVYVENNNKTPGVRVIANKVEEENSKPVAYVPFNEPETPKVEEEISASDIAAEVELVESNPNEVVVGKVAGVSDVNDYSDIAVRGLIVVDAEENRVEVTRQDDEGNVAVNTFALEDDSNEPNKNSDPVGTESNDEPQLASIPVKDYRAYDVYDIDENNARVIAAANSVPRVLGAKIDPSANEFSSPACSFSFRDSKYSSGSDLVLKPSDSGAKVCVDYSSTAARSVAKVNSKIASENTDFVNCVEIEDLTNNGNLTVEVMDSNANYIGSCQLNIAVSEERVLASL